MYRKYLFFIISLQKNSSRDTIPLWKTVHYLRKKRENTKTILSEEYYAIPVSLAQDKLKDIKCQLNYMPIYFLLCCFLRRFSPRFLWLSWRVFILFTLAPLRHFFHFNPLAELPPLLLYFS